MIDVPPGHLLANFLIGGPLAYDVSFIPSMHSLHFFGFSYLIDLILHIFSVFNGRISAKAVCLTFFPKLYIVFLFLSLHTRELSDFPGVGLGSSYLLYEGYEGRISR